MHHTVVDDRRERNMYEIDSLNIIACGNDTTHDDAICIRARQMPSSPVIAFPLISKEVG